MVSELGMSRLALRRACEIEDHLPYVSRGSVADLTTLSLGFCRCTQVKVNFREKEKQVLDNILGPGRYDARIRPSGENGTGEYRDSCMSSLLLPSILTMIP